MQPAYINRIATAVPDHDVHRKFLDFAPSLLEDDRSRRLFRRMADRAQIAHRYSFLAPDPSPDRIDRNGFFRRGGFPDTAARMGFYKDHALGLALSALESLDVHETRKQITHLIVTSCTGFYAPGLDLEIVQHFGLDAGVERTAIGFMGCQAAMPAMKLARHIVRSQPDARILVVNLELCTIHLQETADLQQVLSFLIFADGCAASLVSAQPTGIEVTGFSTTVLPDSSDQITWHIGDAGFRMWLAGTVPDTISRCVPDHIRAILGGRAASDIGLWAVHPGGRSVLGAVQNALGLDKSALACSREVLSDYGNMSSATVMFVLKRLLERKSPAEEGCALAFGPGLTSEAMTFRVGAGA